MGLSGTKDMLLNQERLVEVIKMAENAFEHLEPNQTIHFNIVPEVIAEPEVVIEVEEEERRVMSFKKAEIDKLIKILNNKDFQKALFYRKEIVYEAFDLTPETKSALQRFVDSFQKHFKGKEIILKSLVNENRSLREKLEESTIHIVEAQNEEIERLRSENKSLKMGMQKVGSSHNQKSAEYFAMRMKKPMLEAFQKADPKSDGRPSTYKICEYFNDIGLKTRTGKKFGQKTVYNLIKTQENLGLI